MREPTTQDIERFWSKVHRGGPDDCWEWIGGRSPRGYGVFHIESHPYRANRVVWHFTNGPIPDEMLVCDRCDNPGCVNPQHLFLCTSADNNRDCVEKGRNYARSGSSHDMAKLTENDVRLIRMLASEYTHAGLSDIFGVSASAIVFVIHRLRWQRVSDFPETERSAAHA